MKSKKRNFVICWLLVFINSSFAQITFQKTFGGAQDDVFYSVQQTFDGGYIMVGCTNSFGAGSYDVYLVKTDLNGDTLWTKTYGGTGDDNGNFVQQTIDSGYIITGSTYSFGPGWEIIYLIKTDSKGDTIWTKTYEPLGPFGHGGVSLSVKQTLDGGYILDCTAQVNFPIILLIKTNAVGDTLWTRSYGMHVLGYESSILQTIDSGYIITGTRDESNQYDVYLLKTDFNGNLIWKRTYGGNSFGDHGFSIRQTSDGGYIVTGNHNYFAGGVCLIKTNSLGDTLWTKVYGADSISATGFSIQITNDTGYIIAGKTQSFGTGTWDVCLIKTDSSGDTLWTKSFGGINHDGSSSVQQTTDGGYIVAGNTNSFGSGNSDAYLIKVDVNGNSGCYEKSTSTIVRTPAIIPVNRTDTDSLAISNTILNSYPAIIGNGTTITTLCVDLKVDEILVDNMFLIYPNPAVDNFTILTNEELKNAKVEIYNMLGKKIYSTNLKNSQVLINCKDFLSGMYFTSLRIGGQAVIKKLIINK